MKKKYTILLSIIITEFIIISALDKMKIQAQSWLENAIGLFLFLLPIQILLFLLSKDNRISKNKRMCFKIVFCFIFICYLIGAITTIIYQ